MSSKKNKKKETNRIGWMSKTKRASNRIGKMLRMVLMMKFKRKSRFKRMEIKKSIRSKHTIS